MNRRRGLRSKGTSRLPIVLAVFAALSIALLVFFVQTADIDHQRLTETSSTALLHVSHAVTSHARTWASWIAALRRTCDRLPFLSPTTQWSSSVVSIPAITQWTIGDRSDKQTQPSSSSSQTPNHWSASTTAEHVIHSFTLPKSCVTYQFDVASSDIDLATFDVVAVVQGALRRPDAVVALWTEHKCSYRNHYCNALFDDHVWIEASMLPISTAQSKLRAMHGSQSSTPSIDALARVRTMVEDSMQWNTRMASMLLPRNTRSISISVCSQHRAHASNSGMAANITVSLHRKRKPAVETPANYAQCSLSKPPILRAAANHGESGSVVVMWESNSPLVSCVLYWSWNDAALRDLIELPRNLRPSTSATAAGALQAVHASVVESTQVSECVFIHKALIDTPGNAGGDAVHYLIDCQPDCPPLLRQYPTLPLASPSQTGTQLLSCLVLSCLVLSCLVLSCLVLSCLVLSCLVLWIIGETTDPCTTMHHKNQSPWHWWATINTVLQ
jgi:hypothetical protein